MKPSGSFVFLFFALLSTLSFVFAAPIPSDSEARNEVLKRSPQRLALNAIKFGSIAAAKLRLARQGTAPYGGQHPLAAHKDAVHKFVNSPALTAKYPHLANHKKFTDAFITAGGHKGGRGGDPNNHATVKLSAPGQSKATIHVPTPHFPAIDPKIMNKKITAGQAGRVINVKPAWPLV